MCGIVGYTGRREAEPILLDGLKRLEYRGYDSAGLATVTGDRLRLRKCAGRIADLAALLERKPAPGTNGISHTRWATHGGATDDNAHPHLGGDGAVAVVHNGVIENYTTLKQQLQAKGYQFRSDTDTEVIAQLIAFHLNGDLVAAVRKATTQLKGTYGLAVISPRFAGRCRRRWLGSPLRPGHRHGRGGCWPAIRAALVGHTERVVFLDDRQMCVLTADDWQILNADCAPAEARVHTLEWDTS